jgi:hypothetical protein
MDDTPCLDFFCRPAQTPQRQYEALRAVFVARWEWPVGVGTCRVSAEKRGHQQGPRHGQLTHLRDEEHFQLAQLDSWRDAGEVRAAFVGRPSGSLVGGRRGPVGGLSGTS